MRSEQVKYARPSRDVLNKRSGTLSPISLEDLMTKEVQSYYQDGSIRELLVLCLLKQRTQLIKIRRRPQGRRQLLLQM